MNEFLDIYRLYAKNFDRDYIEKAWDAEDIEKLKKLLDKICGEIENGHIIIGILKNDLDIWQDLEMIYALQNVRDTVFEIESLRYSKDREKKPDQLIEENIEKREKKEKELELERNEVGKWKKILEGEKPLKQYGTIRIYPTIKDYIWDRLPTDFEYADVLAFFKEFYEEKLGRRLKETSHGTYASRYIKYFKEHDPPMISWDEYNYSKDIDKYKIVDKEPGKKEEKTDIQPKPEKAEEIVEDELTKDKVGDGRRLTEETKKLLRDEPGKAKETKKLLKEGQERAKQQKKEEETKKLLSEEHVGEKAEEIIKDELAKNSGFFDEKIEETIKKLEKEDKRIEHEPVKPKPSNPFNDGSAEHYLYQIAVKSNWPSFKKGTPLITIMRRMSDFPKDEVKKAIDMLVKKRKAQRLPNSVAFFE